MTDFVTLRTEQPRTFPGVDRSESGFALADEMVVALRPTAGSTGHPSAPAGGRTTGTGAPVSPGGTVPLGIPTGGGWLPAAPYGLNGVATTPEAGQAIVTRALGRGLGQDLLSVVSGQLPGTVIQSGNVLESILGDTLRQRGISAETINALPEAKRRVLFQGMAAAADAYVRGNGAVHGEATRALTRSIAGMLDQAGLPGGARPAVPTDQVTMAPVMAPVAPRQALNTPAVVMAPVSQGTNASPRFSLPGPVDPLALLRAPGLPGAAPAKPASPVEIGTGFDGSPLTSGRPAQPLAGGAAPVSEPAAPVLPAVTLPPDRLAPLAKAHGALLDRFMALTLDYDPARAFEQGKGLTRIDAEALGEAVKAYDSALAADPLRANTAPALELAPAKAALKGFEAAQKPAGGAALSPASEEALKEIAKQYGTGAADEIARILRKYAQPGMGGEQGAREEIERRANETPGPNAYRSFLEKTAGAAPLGRTNGVPGSSDAGGTGGTGGVTRNGDEPRAPEPSNLIGGTDSVAGPLGELRQALPVLDDLLPLLDGLPQTWNAELHFLDGKLVIPPNETLSGTTRMPIRVPPDLNRALRDRDQLAEGPRSQAYFDIVTAILQPSSGNADEITPEDRQRAVPKPSNVEPGKPTAEHTRPPISVRTVYPDGDQANGLRTFLEMMGKNATSAAADADPAVKERAENVEYLVEAILEDLENAADTDYIRVLVANFASGGGTLGAASAWIDVRTGRVDLMDLVSGQGNMNIGGALLAAAFDLSPAKRLELIAYRGAAAFYRRWGGQEQPLREPDALPEFVWTERPHLIE